MQMSATKVSISELTEKNALPPPEALSTLRREKREFRSQVESVTFRTSLAFVGRMSSWWPHGGGQRPHSAPPPVPTAAETGTGVPGPAVGGTPSARAGMLGGLVRGIKLCLRLGQVSTRWQSPRPQLRSGCQVRGGPRRGQELDARSLWRGLAVLGHTGGRPSDPVVPAAHHACPQHRSHPTWHPTHVSVPGHLTALRTWTLGVDGEKSRVSVDAFEILALNVTRATGRAGLCGAMCPSLGAGVKWNLPGTPSCVRTRHQAELTLDWLRKRLTHPRPTWGGRVRRK